MIAKHGVAVALLFALSGCGLVIAGVYFLAGLAWALFVGAVPCFALAWLIGRGLNG